MFVKTASKQGDSFYDYLKSLDESYLNELVSSSKADIDKISKWDYQPDYELYVRHKSVYDNPKYSENSTKTLFLLHGYTGDAENWVPEYLSDKYNFAVVIPSGENSFWLDGRSTGHQFCKFVGEELVDYVRRVFRLAKDGSETYIMGLSMGGFGALHTR